MMPQHGIKAGMVALLVDDVNMSLNRGRSAAPLPFTPVSHGKSTSNSLSYVKQHNLKARSRQFEERANCKWPTVHLRASA
ncbi:MAG: hypothetical protein AB1646_16795 [Thermodesulfobacteriota bacterium]